MIASPSCNDDPALATTTSPSLSPSRISALSSVRGAGFAVLTVLGATLAAQVAPPAQRGESIGLYGLAMIFNVVGLLWACGVAMRFRSVQAGPLMQTPVFLILFLAPVYVPLALLHGWIHAVARLNPLTFLLEAGRSLLDGHPEEVLTAFGIATALVAVFAVWARTGLARAERAG